MRRYPFFRCCLDRITAWILLSSWRLCRLRGMTSTMTITTTCSLPLQQHPRQLASGNCRQLCLSELLCWQRRVRQKLICSTAWARALKYLNICPLVIWAACLSITSIYPFWHAPCVCLRVCVLGAFTSCPVFSPASQSSHPSKCKAQARPGQTRPRESVRHVRHACAMLKSCLYL